MASNDNTKTAAYENYPANRLGGGSKSAQSIATGASNTSPVETGGFDELGVEVRMTGAANGDLAVTVFPVDSTGAVSGVALAPISSTGPTFASPNVYFFGTYDISTQGRVVVSVKNNNAATQTAQIDYTLH